MSNLAIYGSGVSSSTRTARATPRDVQQFASDLNEVAAKAPLTGIVTAIAVAGLIMATVAAPRYFLVYSIVALAVVIWTAAADKKRRSLPIEYRLSAAEEREWSGVLRGVEWLQSARGIWYADDSSPDAQGICRGSRGSASIGRERLRAARMNVQPPRLHAGHDLYLLPDVLLLDVRTKMIAYRWSAVAVRIGPILYAEGLVFPSDAAVAGKTWLYVTRKGQPDRRRSYNPQLPIGRYTEIALAIGGHPLVTLVVSSADAARHFASSIAAYAKWQGSEAPQPTTSQLAREPDPRGATVSRSVPEDSSERLRFVQRVTSWEPKATAPPVWVPAGRSIELAGVTINGGMFYLAPDSGETADPSAIDPRSAIAGVANRTEDVDYFPSWDSIAPALRREYLEWLAGPRALPRDLGFLFLYFYGLERRVLVDARNSIDAAAELPRIRAELERLREFCNHPTFDQASETLLTVIRIMNADRPIYFTDPPDRINPWQPSTALAVAIAQAARDRVALPPRWAFALALSSPETPRRTPLQRCKQEIEQLFAIRYREAFPEGLVPKQAQKTLEMDHRALNWSIGHVRIPLSGLREFGSLTVAVRNLAKVVDRCTEELDAYSRWMGRNRDGGVQLAGLALLPAALLEQSDHPELDRLRRFLGERLGSSDSVLISGAALLEVWPVSRADRVPKGEAVLLAQALERLGYGIEPDVRFGSPALSGEKSVALFRENEPISSPSDEYRAAMVLAHLSIVVAAADGHVSDEELRLLSDHLSEALHLSEVEHRRLTAHVKWLAATNPGVSGLKRRLSVIGPADRERVGAFLIAVAGADGHIHAKEVDVLTRVFDLLNLEPSILYSDLHMMAVEATELPTVVKGEGASGYSIPSPGMAAKREFDLDMEAVQRKLAETAAVSALLSDVFREEEASMSAGADRHPIDSARALLGRLASKREWPRSELEQIAAELGLLLDGTLENLNDKAFENAGGPLWEGDDPLEIDLSIAKELLHAES